MSDINTEAVSSNQAGIHLATIQLTESDIGPRGSLPSSLEKQNTFLDLRQALSADCHHKNVENILDSGAWTAPQLARPPSATRHAFIVVSA